MFARSGPERRTISWLRNLRTWYGKTTTKLFRAAVDKVVIVRMIANTRSELALEEEE